MFQIVCSMLSLNEQPFDLLVSWILSCQTTAVKRQQQKKCINMLTSLNTVDRDLKGVEELQLLQKHQVEEIRLELRRRMKVFNDLKVLLDLMYLETQRDVSFITCTQMQPQNENEQNSGNKHCTRLVLSFPQMLRLIKSRALSTQELIKNGWIVWDFNETQPNLTVNCTDGSRFKAADKPQMKRGSTELAVSSKFRMNQFDIFGVSQSQDAAQHLAGRQSVRVSLTPSSFKLVLANIEDTTCLDRTTRLKRWFEHLLDYVSDAEQAEGAGNYLSKEECFANCKIILWCTPYDRAVDFTQRRKKGSPSKAG
eukprot:s704_g17.t1